MSDYSSSEGSDDEYGPIATSWGDQTKAEPEKPAADWSSLENPNAKLGPSGLGSGDLHRKGRNYKPIDESLILQQRLKKTSLKSEEGKAAGRQQRRSSRPRGRFSRPSSSTSARSRPRSTFSRSSPKSLRRSSSSSTSKAPTPATTATTTTTTTTTTTVYNYARKPSLSESRQTAPWEEPPKPKKPSVRFSQPLECPTPPLMHSPKIPERALASGDNPWSNKPLMEVPFWAEPAKKPKEPPVESKPPVVTQQPTVIEEKLVEEMEPQPSSHLELSTSTWSSGGVLIPSPVATPTKRADPAPWDSPQTENWLDTFTPVESITPPETISPPETKPSTPEIEPPPPASPIQRLDTTTKADSPAAAPTASDSSWQSSTTNGTSVDDDAWGTSNEKAQDTSTCATQEDTNAWNSPRESTQGSTESWNPDSDTSAQPNTKSGNPATAQTEPSSSAGNTASTNTEPWNPTSDTAQNSSTKSWNSPSSSAQTSPADSWDSPSTTNKTQGWDSSSTPWGSTQGAETTPNWGNNSITQSWNSPTQGSTDSTLKNNDTWGSSDSTAKNSNVWGSTDAIAKRSNSRCSTDPSSNNNNTWSNNDSGWANAQTGWGSSAAAADNGWGSTEATPAVEEKKEPSRFSQPDRRKYSTRSKGPLPANYNNKPLSPPTKVAPPSRVDNPVLVTVNVGLSNDKNIPVHIHLYDDPQALARQFARENAIQTPNIIDAVHKLFANQKAMAMKKRSRPPVHTNYSSARYNHHPHRNYSNV